MLYDLVGFTGSGPAHTNWKPFGDNVPERVARLIHERRMGPAIVVFPDCFTALGGNQYVNSSAIGRYADYLTREIIPFVDREFRTLAAREHRGCFGKSSGGYGAIIHGMKYARHWGAVADHSGDAYFDFVYRCDWPNTLDELTRYRDAQAPATAPTPPLADARAQRRLAEGLDDGRVARFLDAVWGKEKLSLGEGHAFMNLCMAATYDPDPRGAAAAFAFRSTSRPANSSPQRWRNWRRHDPIHLVGRYRANLATLRGIYIDCGWRDQYHIHYGTRILSGPAVRGRRSRHVLRGIRRQPLRHRLPDGHQPAVSLSGAEAMMGHRQCAGRRP